MELYAKVQKSLTQIKIFKRLANGGSFLIARRDAKHAYETGRVTKSNRTFQRLVENDFDVKATLAWYQEERERLQREKQNEERA